MGQDPKVHDLRVEQLAEGSRVEFEVTPSWWTKAEDDSAYAAAAVMGILGVISLEFTLELDRDGVWVVAHCSEMPDVDDIEKLHYCLVQAVEESVVRVVTPTSAAN